MKLQLTLSTALAVVLLGSHCFAKYEKLKLSSCKQSSTYQDAKCERAIDGINQGSCSRVDKGSTGWWKVETERPAVFMFVEIHNNEACCADALTKFKISVDDKVCNEYDGEAFSEKCLHCSIKGTTLKIESSKPDLSLCEISAFGKYLDAENLKLLKCEQSSTSTTHPDAVCNKAIDGNTNQDILSGHSCSHTYDSGWWKAETEKPALIYNVQIYNRNTWQERLTDFKIYVDDKVCYTHDGKVFSVRSFKCLKKGYVLKIESKKPSLTLCEVKVYGRYLDAENLKLLKCEQSSTSTAHPDAACDRAIDGNTNQDILSGHSCSHTYDSGWWKAETEKPALIYNVQIYNRNTWQERLTDFKIYVDDKVCYTHDGKVFSVRSFKCLKKGSVLKIESKKPSLTLCEVKVFGRYID